MPKPATQRTVFLRGGNSRKGGNHAKLSSYTKEGYINRGDEGAVFRVNATASGKKRNGKKRTRTVELAEKAFWKEVKADALAYNFGMPKEQFELVHNLKELNRRKKLGLRLPSTIRLVKRGGNAAAKSHVLVTTYYPSEKKTGIRKDEWSLGFWKRRQFRKDKGRQIQILEREGYDAGYSWHDVFIPYIDPKTKRCVALMLDFGNLVKKEGKK